MARGREEVRDRTCGCGSIERPRAAQPGERESCCGAAQQEAAVEAGWFRRHPKVGRLTGLFSYNTAVVHITEPQLRRIHVVRALAPRPRPRRPPHGVHGRACLPQRGQGRGRDPPWVRPVGDHRRPQEEGQGPGAVEPLPAREPPRRRALQPRVRAALRDHGPHHLGVRGLQLPAARHRQHGDPRALRHRGAEEEVARAAARRRDPLLLLHDRAGRGVVGRHQRALLDHRATATST